MNSGTETIEKVVSLCELMRDDFREQNDVCAADQFLRNQGKIQSLTQLIQYIRYGNRDIKSIRSSP